MFGVLSYVLQIEILTVVTENTLAAECYNFKIPKYRKKSHLLLIFFINIARQIPSSPIALR